MFYIYDCYILLYKLYTFKYLNCLQYLVAISLRECCEDQSYTYELS